MKRAGKILGIIALIIIILFLIIMLAARLFLGKSYDKDDLIKNYENKTEEIHQLKKFINTITPEDYNVYIEYKSRNSIDLSVFEKSDTTLRGSKLLFQGWNINPYNYVEEPQTDYEKEYGGETKSLKLIKEKLNWTDDTFKKVKLQLDNANCISVRNGNICEIGFQRSFLSKYHYLVFDEPLNEQQQEQYSNDCTLLYYKDNIVLTYGSGAIGSLCTPEFQRAKEKN